MPQFSPDQVNFGDIPGYGAWDIGHGREHIQFVQVLAGKTPAILIPDFPMLTFLEAGGARRAILDSHAQAHVLLRAALGITGTDLGQVDLDKQDDFYSWIGYHQQEHALMRQALGIT